jgi:hypothetical protein
MRELSISAAWEETRAILARDGRLFMAVALALVALPSVVSALVNPRGVTGGTTAWWLDLIALAASLIALAGQLALIRLALGPSITVGAAIAHGVKRMPIYFVAVFLLVICLFLAAIPFVLVLSALGVPISARPAPATPATVVTALLFFAFVLFMAVRLLMSSPVASAEDAGPIAILKRSWQLTSKQFWPLFGFLLIFLVGAVIVLVAINSAAGVVIGLLFGTIQPMSAAALIFALVQALVGAAITTLFAVMLARIYLQLAGRGEAQASVPSSGI